ncbi:hypothetical protein C8J56DRAFT_1080162 [Mycena floridula]|nr:hypothetical protein C8J56DRAFT_1080162 [Mycena floridula]
MVLEQQMLHLGDDHERFLKVGSPFIGLTTFLLAPTAASASETSEDDDYLFSDQDYDEEAFQAMDEIASKAYQAMNVEMEGQKQREAEERQRAEEGMKQLEALEKEQLQALQDLRQASHQSRYRPFFTHKKSFELEDESDDEFVSENEDDLPPKMKAPDAGMSHKAWFKKPKYMSNIVYNYFADVVEPQIKSKNGGRAYVAPPSYTSKLVHAPSSLWIYPPEPISSLHRHHFDPALLYRPRVFLWLVHFFVKKLICPNCRQHALEKNGPLTPRRITDIEDSFYIVAWSYYCRDGCKSYFHGWSNKLLNSLPPYIRLAFPATLSQKAGLSRNVMSQLRVGNQHKMGPSGVHSLLLETHTLRFNILQAQYAEAVFEQVRGCDSNVSSTSGVTQTSLRVFYANQVPSFGDFGDREGYNGFVPTERYLASMMNKAIEKDEADANQHTACLAPDQLAIDDSYKVSKHVAKVDGIALFGTMWTCMDSRYIRAQALTLTKAHEERLGPLLGIVESLRLYGYDDPQIVYSDDPVKDKKLIHAAFPSLAENLTPISVARGLDVLVLPQDLKTIVLPTPELVESTLSSWFVPIDDNPNYSMTVQVDAEWNVSRRTGVSILQLALDIPSDPLSSVYIIPVHRFDGKLPASLLRLIIHPRVFKIGSAVKGDLTRLKKQFPALAGQSAFSCIDLKEYAISRGLLGRREAGGLDALAEKILGKYLPKDTDLRQVEEWETNRIPPRLLEYATRDIYTSHCLYRKITSTAPINRVQSSTPAGTRVAVHVSENGPIAAYGTIAAVQPSNMGNIKVKVPTNSRLIVDVGTIVSPSACAILHLSSSGHTRSQKGKGKSGALTLQQIKLQYLASSPGASSFPIVSPVSLLSFTNAEPSPPSTHSEADHPALLESLAGDSSGTDDPASDTDTGSFDDSPESEDPEVELEMIQAHAQATNETSLKRKADDAAPVFDSIVEKLRELVESPPDINNEYTRIKKDIFHAFHMLVLPINHGLRPAFLRCLRDHMLRWDPVARKAVDAVCRKEFKSSFDQMLLRSPRFITERTPRIVPSPSVLVPALEHIFNTFGNGVDARTQTPLFNKQTWQKAHAVRDLAEQGFLSDIPGITLYETTGVDKYGLMKYKCLRGTNKVEGGPHADIYKKFGALHAGPRLTVNSINDHRIWYNLQAMAKHLFNVDWEYHHNLGLINRTSFLLNYLSDIIDGASSYLDWTNGDLYERTNETFGICSIPETMRIRLQMEPFTEDAAMRFKLNSNDDWLRRRQGLALPIMPPTTPSARQFFFANISKYAIRASEEGKRGIDLQAFAKDWNGSADGKDRFYVTTEVLATYAKSWEKSSNVRASEELIAPQLNTIQETRCAFSALNQPFPDYMTDHPINLQPSHGVLDLFESNVPPESSISMDISPSNLPSSQPEPQLGIAHASAPVFPQTSMSTGNSASVASFTSSLETQPTTDITSSMGYENDSSRSVLPVEIDLIHS